MRTSNIHSQAALQLASLNSVVLFSPAKPLQVHVKLSGMLVNWPSRCANVQDTDCLTGHLMLVWDLGALLRKVSACLLQQQ